MVLALLCLVFGDIHGDTLDDLTFRCTDHWVVHAHDLAIDVEEERRGWVEDAWDERGLDQLEVELFGRIIAKDCAGVTEVQLQEVSDAEGLCIDALGRQSADVMVVTGVLAEEARTRRALSLGSNLELQDHLLLLTSAAQKEVFLRVANRFRVLSPALVQLDLRLVGDVQVASVSTLGVVDVDHQVGHLTSQEEALAHDDGHIGRLAADQANFLGERHRDIELRVVHDWADRRHMDALTVANLALAPLVVQEVGADRHQLGLEEVSQLDAELGPPLVEVDSLG